MQSSRKDKTCSVGGAVTSAAVGAAAGAGVTYATLLGVTQFLSLARHAPLAAYTAVQAVGVLDYINNLFPSALHPTSYLGDGLRATSAGAVLDMAAVGMASGLMVYGLYSASKAVTQDATVKHRCNQSMP